MTAFADNVFFYLSQGGAVMVPLGLCSLVMWALILDRVFFFSRLERRDIDLHHLVKLLSQDTGNTHTLPDLPARARGPRTHLLQHLMSHRTHDPQVDRRIADECAMAISQALDKHLAVIAVLAAVAPLFGLLGTVTGMITTFDAITLFGTGNAKAMAGGISVALITTQTGLMVSIPGLYMSGFLTKRAHNVKYRVAATGIYLKRFL